MAVSRAWDETDPAGTDFVSGGDDKFRSLQEDIRERMKQGGHIWNQATLTDEGKHAVDAGGVGISPTLYMADQVTKLMDPFDARMDLKASWPWQGVGGATTKNMTASVIADDAIEIDAKGYKRSIEPLRIWESDPVDTAVNVKDGVYVQQNRLGTDYYAGGNLTIGAGALALPAAGNHAYYLIVLDSAGLLTARKGAEVLLAATPVAPDANAGDTLIGLIDILDTSVNFSLATSGANAFLVEDSRIDAFTSLGNIQVGEESDMLTTSPGAAIHSQAITTLGGVVVIIASFENDSGGIRDYAIERTGGPVFARINNVADSDRACLVGAEKPAAGAHTYEASSDGSSRANLVIFELPATALL
jgi:hypothetical protein